MLAVYLVAPIIGFVLSIGLIPLVIALAHRHDFLDVPSDDRRMHRSPVPRLGGVAISAAVLLPAIIFVAVSLGYDVRFYRTAVLEETNQDYVRTARGSRRCSRTRGATSLP